MRYAVHDNKAELVPEDVPNSQPNLIDGKTLALRTRQRNFLLLRLHGAMEFNRQLKLATCSLGGVKFAIQQDQAKDTAATIQLRKEIIQ